MVADYGTTYDETTTFLPLAREPLLSHQPRRSTRPTPPSPDIYPDIVHVRPALHAFNVILWWFNITVADLGYLLLAPCPETENRENQ